MSSCLFSFFESGTICMTYLELFLNFSIWWHFGRAQASYFADCFTIGIWLFPHNLIQVKSFWTRFSSVKFSHSVMSDSLRPHELQHARPPCPSPSPGVHSDLRPSSPWCHPAISSLGVPFSSCPQSLPASESFPMSQLFTWGGQGTGVSALASFLPKKSQGWSPSEWTRLDWLILCCRDWFHAL